ncbi:MAG: hypothetical protein ACK6CU_20455 [Deltaproteobacteria bacterium]|jgi:hypothetical protein
MTKNRSLPRVLLAALAVTAGCAQPSGTVRIEISGEDIATMGLPVGDIAFADGWRVSIEHVFIAVEDFEISDGTASFPLDAPSTVIDLHAGDQTVWTFTGIPAQRWPQVGYRIARPTPETRRLGEVSQDDLDAMVAAGVSIRFVGTAVHPTHGSLGIDLGLPISSHMEDCQSGTDATDGFVVPASGTHETQMTIHLDHLFFDSARSEEPSLRFEAMAAAAGADRRLEYADLATQNLADLRGLDGGPLLDEEGMAIAYEPPSSGLPMQTLQAFVFTQALGIGHFEGEGHCDYHDHDGH